MKFAERANNGVCVNHNYRYEIKYFIENGRFSDIKNIINLNPAIFTEVYHKRKVNNIYFDTIDFKNYHDNVDGATYRHKYRVRWYGEMEGIIQKPVFEIKSKMGLRSGPHPLDSFS